MVYIRQYSGPPKGWTVREVEINDEWIRRGVEKSCLGTMCQCCPEGCYDRQCVFMTYYMVGVCLLAGLVCLPVLGMVLVKPYTDTLSYRETTCFVARTEYDLRRERCACGKTCSSKYPCLEIYVNYTRYDNTQVSTLLREDERVSKCSYYPGCDKNEDVNARRVEEHRDKYGSGNYSCLYDVTIGSTKVIRVRQLGTSGMVHCILWPSLLIIVSVVFMVLMIRACGCKYVCTCRPPQDVKDAAELEEQMDRNTLQTVFTGSMLPRETFNSFNTGSHPGGSRGNSKGITFKEAELW